MSLELYKKKRNFKKTTEPAARLAKKSGSKFVVQKHHASHLHYDFRLELDGVLKSWAVPKGPSLDPKQKRLAVQVEDHPVEYATFEGEIPAHEYGGGHVIVWDIGSWQPVGENPLADLKKGRLEFELFGEKLRGKWILIRTRGTKGTSWLLLKRTDEYAKSGKSADLTVTEPNSVITGRSVSDLKVKPVETKKPSAKNPKKENRSKTVSAKSPRQTTVFPAFIEPQLARLSDVPPTGSSWVHEIKLDGYRTLCRIGDLKNGKERSKAKSIQLLTRSGLDWTEKYGKLATACQQIPGEQTLLDGEIVCVDEKGRSHFQLLQKVLKEKRTSQLLYFAFDLLFLNGVDLRERPLIERKALLAKLIQQTKSPKIIFSQHWETSGQKMLAECYRLELEGIVSKRADAPYESDRGDNWLKSKCGFDQEFVIVGFTPPKGTRIGFGALLLGAHQDDGKLKYVGRVGTGFGDTTIHELMDKLEPFINDHSPFTMPVPEQGSITWVRPVLVAQIKFSGFTGDGMIRHGSFTALREDKSAAEVMTDLPPKKKSAKAQPRAIAEPRTTTASLHDKSRPVLVNGVRLTHPTRQIFNRTAGKIRKVDLAEAYALLAPRMMPHLQNRPLSLLRCPDGAEGTCFFQKHITTTRGSAIHTQQVKVKERDVKTEEIMTIDSVEGLISLVQMGVVEIHNWGCVSPQIEKPDTVVFDLDPDASVSWPQMIEGALAIKDILDRLKLGAFLKVTGGKGLHIHVPVEPRYSWDQIKLFAKTVATNLAVQEPELYTAQMLKNKRKGKIFIDYLRNGYGATAVAPYSVRAKLSAPVALPIRWNELTLDLKPDQFRLSEIEAILKSRRRDPWVDFEKQRAKIMILETPERAAPKKRKTAKKRAVK
jgi:bifunctional non-homologous end joining protein LigD